MLDPTEYSRTVAERITWGGTMNDVGNAGLRRVDTMWTQAARIDEIRPAVGSTPAVASDYRSAPRAVCRVRRLSRSDITSPSSMSAPRKSGRIHIPDHAEIAPNSGGASVDPV